MTKRKPEAQDKKTVYREAFLAQLGRHLTSSSSQWPTTLCWTELSLKKLVATIRDELAERGLTPALTYAQLIEWLVRLGLAHDLATEGEGFYLLDLGGSEKAEADPYELMMAAKPAGIICYFSAVAFHSLSTQPVAHHHVATVVPSATSPDKHVAPRAPAREAAPESAAPRTARQKLGTLLFQYQGTPYYSTNRSDRLIPGLQLRGYGPRSQIRITTLEQTLLDTLSKPFHCGGPEVAFEAWREGIASERINEERMADYLTTMNYPATTRRAATMLAILEYQPGRALQQTFDACRNALDPDAPFATISLLPGVDYTNLNADWLVNVP